MIETKPQSILLFAAGFGTRMRPLTLTKPKPLIEVAGMPLLDHALAFCTGLNRVVNCHYLADQIIEHVAGQNIQISDERDTLLDTGGGLKKALTQLGFDPVFTMNTDAVWAKGDPISTLSAAWDPDKMDGLLLLIPKHRATGHKGTGDFDRDPSGALSKGNDHVYTGVQIINTDGLHDIGQTAFSMWALWSEMLENGRLYGTVFEGNWCDVGQPESIALAENMLKDATDV